MNQDRTRVGSVLGRGNGMIMNTKPSVYKKVEIVYYLSKNGQLDHPHFMELTLLSHHQLRLRDFMERLTVLRGKALPLLYSWSYKRIYKNGYVWNDLAENDVISPADGNEYVLKGSEIASNCNNGQSKSMFLESKRRPMSQHLQYDCQIGEETGEFQVKTRCSRGVSTEEIEEFKAHEVKNNIPTEMAVDPSSFSVSPPSSASSTHSDNSNAAAIDSDDGDQIGVDPMLSKNSMLFSLISCGGLGSFRKPAPPPPSPASVSKEQPNSGRKSCSLHRVVVRKAAEAAVRVMAEEEEEMMMIKYMPENPRFGNPQSEEKEYFSGSIVETITNDQRLNSEPPLKKSASYNEEKCLKMEIVEVGEKEEMKNGKLQKWTCIPRKHK